ncbi:MAG: hypothetical protein FJW47_02835 [Actinobacteria bacterium]|nr:hypothetical protein [Actinomycetota bacterium]
MKFLPRIKSPSDLARLSSEELNELSQETRTFLIDKVSKSGGHLGPNLGIVEVAVARQLVSWFSSGAKQEGTQLHVDESASHKPTH